MCHSEMKRQRCSCSMFRLCQCHHSRSSRPPRLFGGEGDQLHRVHGPRHFLPQQGVDGAVALEGGQALKFGRDDLDGKVRLPGSGRALGLKGVPRMLGRLVLDLQAAKRGAKQRGERENGAFEKSIVLGSFAPRACVRRNCLAHTKPFSTPSLTWMAAARLTTWTEWPE